MTNKPVFRKKAHEPSIDEEWCPRRKIKKTVHVLENRAETALVNVSIVSRILDHLISETPVMKQLELRLISRTFNHACLHAVRKQFRHVEVVSLNSEQKKDEDQRVEINDKIISLSAVARFFQFLRCVATVRIETIEFVGFLEDNKIVHDCILQELFKFNSVHIRCFKGADEICENGCMMCYVLASHAKIYGPMQWFTIHEGFGIRRHFQHLLITEILLAQIALYCLESITSPELAIKKMKEKICSNVTCDVLEIVVSDRLMMSPKSPTHPRNVIDCIVRQWKPKSVKLKFMTEYSSCDGAQWREKRVFDELRFDSHSVVRSNMPHSERLSRLEIDLSEGDAIAECIISDRVSTLSDCSSLDRICSNVKRVFPSDHVFITLPLAVHDFAREKFGEFCAVLMEFVWSDEKAARNSQFFVRLFCYGLTNELVRQSLQTAYLFNGRPIVTSVEKNNGMCSEPFDSFSSWKPETRMRNFLPAAHVSFRDPYNRCAVHLEVCVEITNN